jgi:hypothetical protein
MLSAFLPGAPMNFLRGNKLEKHLFSVLGSCYRVLGITVKLKSPIQETEDRPS